MDGELEQQQQFADGNLGGEYDVLDDGAAGDGGSGGGAPEEGDTWETLPSFATEQHHALFAQIKVEKARVSKLSEAVAENEERVAIMGEHLKNVQQELQHTQVRSQERELLPGSRLNSFRVSSVLRRYAIPKFGKRRPKITSNSSPSVKRAKSCRTIKRPRRICRRCRTRFFHVKLRKAEHAISLTFFSVCCCS